MQKNQDKVPTSWLESDLFCVIQTPFQANTNGQSRESWDTAAPWAQPWDRQGRD